MRYITHWLILLVFNAQMISDLPKDVVFPEYCGDSVATSDGKNSCDVYITIPANAIIYQRSIESMYICMFVHRCDIATYIRSYNKYIIYIVLCVGRSKGQSVLDFP